MVNLVMSQNFSLLYDLSQKLGISGEAFRNPIHYSDGKPNKVTGLEEYIKKEKDESNEVAKYSQRQLHKIKDNADTLEILIRSLKV